MPLFPSDAWGCAQTVGIDSCVMMTEHSSRLPRFSQQPITDDGRCRTVRFFARQISRVDVPYENLVSDDGCCTYYRLSVRVNRLLCFFVTLLCHRKSQREVGVFNGSYFLRYQCLQWLRWRWERKAWKGYVRLVSSLHVVLQWCHV